MFAGEYRHTIDDKGRITLPAKLRRPFADGAAVALGEDGCLQVYPWTDWLERETKVRQLQTSDPDTLAYVRILAASLHVGEVDKQHRLFLPPQLRAEAALDKDVIITGAITRVEIWNEARWLAYKEKYLPSYTEIAQKSGLGI